MNTNSPPAHQDNGTASSRSTTPTPVCRVCKKTNAQLTPPQTNKRCSKCREVYYCGRDCQKADWKVHKHVCAALKNLATESFSSESEDERIGASRKKTSLLTGKKPTREERRARKRADLLFEHPPGEEEMLRSMGISENGGFGYDPFQDEDLMSQYRGKEDFEDFFMRRSDVHDALNG